MTAVEQIFRERQLKFARREKGHMLFFPSPNYNFPYPCYVWQHSDGSLRIELWIPREQEGAIRDLDEFVELVGVSMPEEVLLLFCNERQKFYLLMGFDAEEFDEGLECFARTADAVIPLCGHVGELLDWSDDLVAFAFQPTEGDA